MVLEKLFHRPTPEEFLHERLKLLIEKGWEVVKEPIISIKLSAFHQANITPENGTLFRKTEKSKKLLRPYTQLGEIVIFTCPYIFVPHELLQDGLRQRGIGRFIPVFDITTKPKEDKIT